MLEKVKNVWHRPFTVGGVEVRPGETKNVPREGPFDYLLAMGHMKIIYENVRIEETRKDKLLKMKMSELREIGDKVGAKDTKKSELVEEILEKED